MMGRLLGTCLLVVCAPLSAQPTFVPLNSIKAGTVDERVKPKPPPASVAAPLEAPDAAPVVQETASPQATPIAAAEPLVAPGVAPTAGLQRQLQLTCLGGGTANKATSASAYNYGNFDGSAGTTSFSGNIYGTTTISGTRPQAYGDQVDIHLFSGDDRIRLPRTTLPLLHGGDHGWFKLKEVIVDAHSIRASAAVNFINNPKVYIDRVTGRISISGKGGDYSGQCRAIAADAPVQF